MWVGQMHAFWNDWVEKLVVHDALLVGGFKSLC